jgi:type III secretion protein Q
VKALGAEDRRLIALAAVFAPSRTGALLGRLVGGAGATLLDAAVRSAAGERRERLAALGAALEDGAPRDVAAEIEGVLALERGPTTAAARTALRCTGGPGTTAFRRLLQERLTLSTDRRAVEGPPDAPRRPASRASSPGGPLARDVKSAPEMALPFDMPPTSSGFAQLTRSARELGERVAVEASRVLGALTGAEVTVAGRPLPCVPAPTAGAVRLRLELTALPGTAAVEVGAPLAAALLDRLAGGRGAFPLATDVTPLERSALELAVLATLDALRAVPEVETPLAPRLARSACEPLAGLTVDLSVSLGESRGWARLILPVAAVRALGAGGLATGPAADVAVELSLRAGSAPLSPDELDSLAPGDVILLDPLPPCRLRAVAPGGLCLEGIEEQGGLTIEEIRMTDASSECTVSVEVELARVPVTLRDLVRLEPGAVLPLPIDRQGWVTLRVGDRTLGRGQLVDVDGAVGVRIDSLAGERR